MLLNHYTEMSFIRAKSDIIREVFAKTEKFNLDIWYVQNQSLIVDFKILIKTFLVVINKKGINNSNETIMPLFNGKN